MSQEIELYSKMADPIAAIEKIGVMFTRSGMFGCDKIEQGQVLAMVCLSERKSPVVITRLFDIVEGKLRKKALACLAEFNGKGGKHKWLSSGDEQTTKPMERYAEIQLTAADGETIKYRYSMADALAEGLIKDKSRWVKRPGNMLRARCISNGLGMLDPGIFAGEDADSDEPTAAPAAALSLTPEPVPTTVPEKPAVDVVSVVTTVTDPPEDQATLASQGLAPEPVPFGVATEAELKALHDAISTFAPQALAFIRRSGLVKPNEGFEALKTKQVNRILNNLDTFRNGACGTTSKS